MGTTLTGTTPQDTYDSLIKVTDNGPLSGTAKYLSDGLGNDSVLALSTSRVGINTTSPAYSLDVSSTASEVLRLQGTSGGATNNTQLRFYGSASAADLWAIGTEVSTGTTGRAFDFYDLVASANRMRIDASGNLGIGTTPAAWGASTRALQLGAYGSLNALGGVDIGIANNAYYDGSNWVYIASQEAGKYLNNRNTFIFSTAPAGTAGANVTFTDVVRIDADGLKFNGDTAAANALDDYEEGTWTMGISFGGSSVGVTTSANTGTYTKIGRQVTVSGVLALTSKGSSTGSAKITGLPFTIGSGLPNFAAASLRIEAITFANQFQALGSIASTNIELEEVTEAGINTTLSDADFANNSTIMISFTYNV